MTTTMYAMLATLETANGFWNSRAWVLVFALAALTALWIRAMGRKDSRTGGESQKPFISGNGLEDPEAARVAASHMYWGFLEALKGYYRRMTAFHSGNLADYLMWFLTALAVLLLLGRIS